MNPTTNLKASSTEQTELTPELERLFRALVARAPREAVKLLDGYPETFVVEMLELLNPAMAVDVLECLPDDRQQAVLAAAPAETSRQWMRNEAYPEHTIGRLMQPSLAVFARRRPSPKPPSKSGGLPGTPSSPTGSSPTKTKSFSA